MKASYPLFILSTTTTAAGKRCGSVGGASGGRINSSTLLVGSHHGLFPAPAAASTNTLVTPTAVLKPSMVWRAPVHPSSSSASPLDALRPAPLPIAGDAKPFFKTGAAAAASQPPRYPHHTTATVSNSQQRDEKKSHHHHNHTNNTTTTTATATSNGGIASAATTTLTGPSASFPPPSSSSAAAASAYFSYSAAAHDRQRRHPGSSTPRPRPSWSTRGEESSSTTRAVAKKTKKAAVKLSSLLVNHHRHSGLLPVASSAKPYGGNASELMRRHHVALGQQAAAAAAAENRVKESGARAEGADENEDSHGVADSDNPNGVEASGETMLPFYSSTTTTTGNGTGTGASAVAVSPSVLKAQEAIAAAEAEVRARLQAKLQEKEREFEASQKQEREWVGDTNNVAGAGAPPTGEGAPVGTPPPRSTKATRAAGTSTSNAFTPSSGGGFQKMYTEHRIMGWSPRKLYRVVSDVSRYQEFLPWCVASVVHASKPMVTSSATDSHSEQQDSLPPSGLPKKLSFTITNPELQGAPKKSKLSWLGKRGQAAAAAAGTSSPSTATTTTTATTANTSSTVAPTVTVATEMTATLTVGFAFLKEKYTSRVQLEPNHRVVATLHDGSDKDLGGNSTAQQANANANNQRKNKEEEAARKSQTTAADGDSGSVGGFFSSFIRRAVRSLPAPPTVTTSAGTSSSSKGPILRQLRCEWVFFEVPGQPDSVEVKFSVAFEFRHPMYGALIMSNIVSLMTSSFERRCEEMFGPPSQPSHSVEDHLPGGRSR